MSVMRMTETDYVTWLPGSRYCVAEEDDVTNAARCHAKKG